MQISSYMQNEYVKNRRRDEQLILVRVEETKKRQSDEKTVLNRVDDNEMAEMRTVDKEEKCNGKRRRKNEADFHHTRRTKK